MDFLKKKSKDIDNHFYHDLINQTHSLTLFLSHKLAQNIQLDLDEMSMIKQEIEVLQKIIVNHSGQRHKNVSCVDDVREITEILSLIESLFYSYFSTNNCEIVMKGFDQLSAEYLIDVVSFHRIVTNLIKNISEAEASFIEIKVSVINSSLQFKIKNNFTVVSSELGGVGLSSIRSLVEK